MSQRRPVSTAQIEALEANGCRAEDWSEVVAAEGLDADRVHAVQFVGHVSVGTLHGHVETIDGVRLPAGLHDVTLVDCELGDDVLIARIGSHIANYRIDDGACITDVGVLSTRPAATFGHGAVAETVNEGGGREVTLFAELSSQFAYLQAMHRHDAALSARLQTMAEETADAARSDQGFVGAGACVAHVGSIVDVCIGPAAQVVGATRLCNGTILSESAAPALVGAGVCAEDFIIAEGAQVEDGAVLHTAFVGQGVQVGKQFSAENSLFFANSEAFHGEACSIFAGPYTVTHHKSSLLIAGIYSFYNAGSGTNQSNHMYKLGPVHQGVIERGTKNGSFSYMRWPSAVGPFCVIIGKHLNNFDLSDLPFSYLTEEGGDSLCTPSMNMFTVGTVRDGDKWPTRDRRKATTRRDQIRFEVYSPYTVGKMMRGESALNELYERTDRDVDQVRYQGVIIKRLLLRRSARNYASSIDAYLRRKLLDRAASAREEADEAALQQALTAGDGIHSLDWADVGGLLIAGERLRQIERAIVAGELASPAAVNAAFAEAAEAYEADEWEWVRHSWLTRKGDSPDQLGLAELEMLAAEQAKWEATFTRKILADAEKEFDPVARYGYGIDGDEDTRDADFVAVRGSYTDNSFVRQMQARLDQNG